MLSSDGSTSKEKRSEKNKRVVVQKVIESDLTEAPSLRQGGGRERQLDGSSTKEGGSVLNEAKVRKDGETTSHKDEIQLKESARWMLRLQP